jgi:hypothetical protein
MTKQVYNIIIHEDNVQVFKNDVIVYEVSSKVKTISLAELYNKMSVDINDEYFFLQGLKRIESPQNDPERIFNNTYDFIGNLIVSLNKKLKELREKQSADMF